MDSTGTPLWLNTEAAADVVILRPAGVLSVTTAPDLLMGLLKSLAEQPRGVVVDLFRLTLSDDLSLTVFAAAARHASAWPGCAIVVCATTATVAKQLADLGVDRHVTIVNSLDDALEVARRPHLNPSHRRDYPPVLDSVAEARAFADEVCRDWGIPDRQVGILRLVVTELVGNAVVHARTGFEFTLRRTARYIHVAVRDRDPRLARITGPSALDGLSGRGLILVEGFARSWGCTPTDEGKVTWATIARDTS